MGASRERVTICWNTKAKATFLQQVPGGVFFGLGNPYMSSFKVISEIGLSWHLESLQNSVIHTHKPLPFKVRDDGTGGLTGPSVHR